MRICFTMYHGSMYSGGQGIYLYYLTRELARRGHEVHVIAAPPYPELDAAVTIHPLESWSFWTYLEDAAAFMHERNPLKVFEPVNLWEFTASRATLSQLILMFTLRAHRKLQELWREVGPFDLVHDNQALGYGMLFMKQMCPVVATIHHPLTVDMRNSVQQARSTYEKVRRMLFFPWKMQQYVAQRMDALLTVSHTSARSIAGAFHLDPDSLQVIHIGVDTDVFRPLPGVKRARGHILYVGNSEDRNKGARYLFEALRMLRDEEEFHLSVVDRPRHELKMAPTLVREYGLGSRVHFLGRVPTEELVRLYNRAEFAVCASLYEGFGLPPAEAAACGTPLLSTNGGALSEVLEDGKSALLVPPGDAQALASGIRRMLHDPELRERLARGSRAEIIRRFDWARTAAETEEVYERVTSNRHRRSGHQPEPVRPLLRVVS